MKSRKRLVLGSAVIAILLLFLFLTYGLNPALESVLQRYLERELVVHSADTGFSLDFETLDLDIYNQTLSLNQLRAQPEGESGSAHLEKGFGELRIGRATVHGISLMNFLWDDGLDIQSIVLDTLSIHIHKHADSLPAARAEAPPRSALRVDSIRLKGVSNIDLRLVELDHFRLDLLQAGSNDTLSSFYGDRLAVTGVELVSRDKRSFVPKLDQLELQLDKQQYLLMGGLYGLSFDRFNYNHQDRRVAVDRFRFEPLADRDTLRAHYSQSYESYTARFRQLQIEDLDLNLLLEDGEFRASSLLIDSLDAQIYRDKTLPYNTSRHVPLPASQLAGMHFPIRVDSVRIENSNLGYYEELPEAGKFLEIEFPELDATFWNIRSAYLARESTDTLKIKMRALVRGAIPVDLDIGMPYASDAFWFDGHSEGHSDIRELNPVVFPSTGLRFTSGRLNGLFFNAAGNSHRLNGELAMLYKNLKVELLKEGEKRKALSWVANVLVTDSNPNRFGKTIVGVVEFRRTPYKGMWNYVWKAVESGLVNSLTGLGKRHESGSPTPGRSGRKRH